MGTCRGYQRLQDKMLNDESTRREWLRFRKCRMALRTNVGNIYYWTLNNDVVMVHGMIGLKMWKCGMDRTWGASKKANVDMNMMNAWANLNLRWDIDTSFWNFVGIQEPSRIRNFAIRPALGTSFWKLRCQQNFVSHLSKTSSHFETCLYFDWILF